MKRLVVLLAVLLSLPMFDAQATLTKADILSPAARLRKLSLSLKGELPSAEDYEIVNKLQSGQVDSFLAQKAKEYANSDEYVFKMQQRLQQLYRIRISENMSEDRASTGNGFSDLDEILNATAYNSLDQIFIDIAKNNLSWDQLLLSKTYQIFDRKLGGMDFISDAGFYAAAFPEQVNEAFDGAFTNLGGRPGAPKGADGELKDFTPQPKQTVTAKTPSQNLITAGSLTTSRFFSRYASTKLNKNRRQAAAVFRIFLCDDMRPVVLPSQNENIELLAMAFNEDGQHTDRTNISAVEKRHGSDPACQSCHYKLDPAGKTFLTSSNVLNPVPSPGALTYKRADGSLVNIPVKGIGELATAITSQPEYMQCQVKHFWDWFIGKDVVLSEKRRDELVQKFNSVGRKPKDFILYLVTQPEYQTVPKPAEQNITLASVRPILKQCNSCHEKSPTAPPRLDQFPIGGSPSSHQEWLSAVVTELDLVHDGEKATMPPKRANWKLSKEENALMKRWLLEGAKDDSGQASVTQDFIGQTLPGQSVVATRLEPTFEDTFFRFFENHSFSRILVQLFGNFSDEECHVLSEANKSILGVRNPLDGRALFSSVSPNYLKYVQKCTQEALDNRVYQNATFKKYGVIPGQDGKSYQLTQYIFWNSLSAEAKALQIRSWAEQLFGPGVQSPATIRHWETKLIKALDTLNADRLMDMEKAMKLSVSIMISSEEFLTY